MFPPFGDKPSDPMESLIVKQLQLSRAKLKASGRVSALLAGFAIVGIIELEIVDTKGDVPEILLIAYTVLISLLIAVHMIAVLISTCILPHLDSYLALREFEHIEKAPHLRLRTFIEVAWVCSTVVGILLFLAVVVLACWIKFWHLSQSAAVACTVIMIPALFVLVGFTIRFYYSLTAHKVECANEMMDRLDKHLHDLTDSHGSLDLESGKLFNLATVALTSTAGPSEVVKHV